MIMLHDSVNIVVLRDRCLKIGELGGQYEKICRPYSSLSRIVTANLIIISVNHTPLSKKIETSAPCGVVPKVGMNL